ncbi:hypothetical protein MY11210_002011 [Beauveria gryllotalpidicola]
MNFCVTTRRGTAAAATRAQCTRRWAHSKTKPAKPRLGSKPKPKPKAPATPHKPASQARPRPPPPPRSHPQQADTLLTVWRATWLPLSGAALVAGALGFYIFGTAAATYKAGASPCACDGNATPTGRPPALTGDNAEQFDKELDWPEFWMGITSLRRRLAAHARGNVLELAMGSGRNLAYYDWSPITNALEAAAAAAAVSDDDDDDDETKKKKKKTTTTAARAAVNARGITSFTGLDISADMLDVACKKLTKTVPPLKDAAPIVRAASSIMAGGGDGAGQLSFLSGRLRLVRSDAHHALPPAPPPPSSSLCCASPRYDTVIQTFGLCSVADPVAVLANLASAVKPGTGRIVLLEHGRGFFGLVNGLLDRNAGRHFAKYGCWWNRDIEALVEEAARTTPGLTIVKVERPKVLQMGTLVWVELKVEEMSARENK